MVSFTTGIDAVMHCASVGFAVIGASFIVLGGLRTLYHCLRHATSLNKALMQIRLQLGHMIILGLEFIVAGDILETIITPSYDRLGILAILVIIRTVLSYFLGKELRDLSSEEQRTALA